MSSALERALSRLRRSPRHPAQADLRAATPEAFRAVMEERLRNLERQVDEVKGRVNGLLILLAGAVAAQFVLRLVA